MEVNGNNNTASANKDIDTGDNLFRNLSGYNDIESYTVWDLIDDVYLSLLETGTIKENVTSADESKY